jgi:hypothetical protein
MIAGAEYGNDLATCTPYTSDELAIAQKQTFGFGYRHILGGCMHCALWTRLDILTACLVLAQYQASPGSLHVRALKHLVGYLRLHPDIPLTFNRSTIPKEISAIAIKTLALQGLLRNEIAVFNAIGTENNRSDHFTKPLPYPAFRNHVLAMMGMRFLTQAHAILTVKRNQEEIENG